MNNFNEVRCNCKECGKEMEIVFQSIFNPSRANVTHNGSAGIALATCKTPGCAFNGVTLQPEEHANLTDDQREAYRAQVADIAARQTAFNWRAELAG